MVISFTGNLFTYYCFSIIYKIIYIQPNHIKEIIYFFIAKSICNSEISHTFASLLKKGSCKRRSGSSAGRAIHF